MKCIQHFSDNEQSNDCPFVSVCKINEIDLYIKYLILLDYLQVYETDCRINKPGKYFSKKNFVDNFAEIMRVEYFIKYSVS